MHEFDVKLCEDTMFHMCVFADPLAARLMQLSSGTLNDCTISHLNTAWLPFFGQKLATMLKKPQ